MPKYRVLSLKPCCFVFYWPVTQIAFSIIFIFWAVPLALVIFGLLAITLWFGFADLFHRRWRRSISMFAFPGMLITAIPAAIATDYSTSWLTFIVKKSRYVADVRKATEAGKHFLLWDWGGNVMIGFNRFLVWDAQDEVALPRAQQTRSWRAQFPVTEYVVVRKLEPHFYLIDDR